MTSSQSFRDEIGLITTPSRSSQSEENKIALTVGLLFEYDNCSYRLIGLDSNTGTAFLAVMGKNTLCITSVKNLDLWKYYYEGSLKPVKEEFIPIQYELLSEEEKKTFEAKKKAMDYVRETYGPDYMKLVSRNPKPDLEQLADDCGMDYNYFRRMLTKYILSGFKDHVLLSKRSAAFGNKTREPYNYRKKPGRPSDDDLGAGLILTDKIRAQFRVVCLTYLSTPKMTLQGAYNALLGTFYPKDKDQTFDDNTKPIDQVPTKRQLDYFIRKASTLFLRKTKKLDAGRTFNNYRNLDGESKSYAMGPGDIVSIDANEVELYLVHGEERFRLLGRPILYAMIDVYTKLILAVSLSFDNNSFIGLTGLFLNLADTIPGFAEKNGLEIDGAIDAWVSNIIPNAAYTDRGSDFMSEGFNEICKRLNIMRAPNPPRTPSLKGDVERFFRGIHASQEARLDNNGLITREYNSNHKKYATMDIREYSQLVAASVIAYNSHILTNSKWNEELIEKKVEKSPKGIWDYYTQEKMFIPRRILDLENYYFDLMLPGRAAITRKGLSFHGLLYNCKYDKKLSDDRRDSNPAIGGKSKKMNIRYDPRDTTFIYYVRDGEVYYATIDNPNREADSSFAHMSWSKYFSLRREASKEKKLGEHKNTNISIALDRLQKQVVDTAKGKESRKNDTKNIRDNREKAKEEFRQNDTIFSRMKKEKDIDIIDTNSSSILPEQTECDVQEQDEYLIITDLDEIEFGDEEL